MCVFSMTFAMLGMHLSLKVITGASVEALLKVELPLKGPICQLVLLICTSYVATIRVQFKSHISNSSDNVGRDRREVFTLEITGTYIGRPYIFQPKKLVENISDELTEPKLVDPKL